MVILAWSQMLIVKKAAGAVSDEPLILSDVLLDPKAETGARTRLRRLRSEHRLRRFEVFGPFLGVLFEVAIDAHGTEQPLTLLPRSINDFITVVRSRDASRPDGRYRVVGSQDEQVVLSPESRRGRNILATFMFIVLHREIAVTQVLPVEQNTTARELRHANMELTLINSELQQRLGAKEVEVVSLRSELKLANTKFETLMFQFDFELNRAVTAEKALESLRSDVYEAHLEESLREGEHRAVRTQAESSKAYRDKMRSASGTMSGSSHSAMDQLALRISGDTKQNIGKTWESLAPMLRHVSLVRDDADDAEIMQLDFLRSALKLFSETYGSEKAAHFLEYHLPASVYEATGLGIRRNAMEFIDRELNGELEKVGWEELWMSNVPNAFSRQLISATSSRAEREGTISQMASHKLLVKSMTNFFQMLSMIDPRCSGHLQEPLAAAHQSKGGSVAFLRLLNTMGLTVSRATRERRRPDDVSRANLYLKTLLGSLIDLGVPINVALDNADWSGTNGKDVHVIAFLAMFMNRLASPKPRTPRTPFCDLEVSQILNQNKWETAAALKQQSRREQLAFDELQDTAQEELVIRLLSEGALGLDINLLKTARDQGTRGRPVHPTQVAPVHGAVPVSARLGLAIKAATSDLKFIGRAPKIVTAFFDYVPPGLPDGDQPMSAGGPVRVQKGDLIELIVVHDSARKSAVVRNCCGEVGYVPLAVVTGREQDYPPPQFSHLTSPIRVQRSLPNGRQGRLAVFIEDDFESDDGSDASDESETEEGRSFERTAVGNDYAVRKTVAIRASEVSGSPLPRHAESHVIMGAFDGRAHNLIDVLRACDEKTKFIQQCAANLTVKLGSFVLVRTEPSLQFTEQSTSGIVVQLPIIGGSDYEILCDDGVVLQCKVECLRVRALISFTSDAQEFHLVALDAWKQRKSIVAKLSGLKDIQKSALSSQAVVDSAKQAVKTMELALKALDSSFAIRLGGFHGVMVVHRAVNSLNSGLNIAALYSAAGYSAQLEKITTCASGYLKLCYSLDLAANIAWNSELLHYSSKMCSEGASREEIIMAAKKVVAVSNTAACYDRALSVHLGIFLDMHDAGGLSGLEAFDLFSSTEKRAIRLCSVSGNSQYFEDFALDVVTLAYADDARRTTQEQNPTASLRDINGSFFYGDHFNENFGIRTLKEHVGNNPHESTIIREAGLASTESGALRALEEEVIFGKGAWDDFNTREHREVVNLPHSIACMRSAIRILFDAIDVELKDDRDSLPPRPVSILLGAGVTAQPSTKQDPEFIKHLESTADGHAEVLVKYFLGGQFGGSVADAPKKICVHKKLALFEQGRSLRLGSIMKSRAGLTALLAMVLKCPGKSQDAVLTQCHSLATFDEHGRPSLRYTNKSSARKAARDYFNGQGENGFLAYTGCGLESEGQISNRAISSSSFSETHLIAARVHDSCATMRRVKISERTGTTGSDVMLQVLKQTMGKDLKDGCLSSHLVFDVFFDTSLDDPSIAQEALQKSLQNKTRNSKKRSTAPASSFVEGALGSFSNARLQETFQDRELGRVDMLRVLGRLIRAPTALEAVVLIGLLGEEGRSMAVSGAGATGSERGRTVRLTAVRGSPDGPLQLSISEDELRSNHFEDAEVVRQACLASQHFSGGVEIIATDTDIWQLAVVAVDQAQLRSADGERGPPLYVRLSPQTVDVAGVQVQEELMCVNSLAMNIRLDPRCIAASIPLDMRVLNYIAATLLLGSDSTSCIPGMSHNRGLNIFMEELSYIGCLVTKADAAAEAVGWTFTYVPEAALRFFKVIYCRRDPMAVADLSNGIAPDAWARLLESVAWNDLQRRVAARNPTKFDWYLPSIENITQHIMRAQSRLHGIVNATVQQPSRIPLAGFRVLFNKDGAEITKDSPTADELVGVIIVNVDPVFLPSSLEDVYSFPTMPIKTVMRSIRGPRVGSTTLLCSRCHHNVHRNRACATCATDPCVLVCSRCSHEPHEGTPCSSCAAGVIGTSLLCQFICPIPDCRHPGKRSEHSLHGCSLCGDGQACNAVAQQRNATAINAADDISEDSHSGSLVAAMNDECDDAEQILVVTDASGGCDDDDADVESDIAHIEMLRSIVSALSMAGDEGSRAEFDAAMIVATDAGEGPDLELAVQRHIGSTEAE